MTYRKKLIEVALPLDAINKESLHEKGNPFLKGHPRNMHQWWSRKPLATCRAVLFASLVDDPSEHPEKFPNEQEQIKERLRLFRIIESLIKWENSNNEDLLALARAEILKSVDGNLPPVYDPFCGGGAIPLEAQRLGLETYASDLNPVAVLITKSLIEIPPKFNGQTPINPNERHLLVDHSWHGSKGLANDIRYYGRWLHEEAKRRVEYLYPKATLSNEYGSIKAPVIAWLWVRTVKCPNPACGVQMPLISKWWLTKKEGKETWAEPVINYFVVPPTIYFSIKSGSGQPPSGTVNRQGASCLVCKSTVHLSYIRSEAKQGRMHAKPLVIVAEGKKGRVYLPFPSDHEKVISNAEPLWKPEALVTTPSHDVDRLPMYGMYTWGDAFTSRQLIALNTFSDLLHEVKDKIIIDASNAGLPFDNIPLKGNYSAPHAIGRG